LKIFNLSTCLSHNLSQTGAVVLGQKNGLAFLYSAGFSTTPRLKRVRNFMIKSPRQRLLTILSLLIVTPLGFLSKFYSGPLHEWCNDFGGDILYEIFWCLFVFLLIPSRKTLTRIPVWVFGITCVIEFLQLWKSPFWEAIRATFIGRTLLGTTFVWWDFPHYAVGCLIGWLWLRQISRTVKDYG
jgi:hypothetical protein